MTSQLKTALYSYSNKKRMCDFSESEEPVWILGIRYLPRAPSTPITATAAEPQSIQQQQLQQSPAIDPNHNHHHHRRQNSNNNNNDDSMYYVDPNNPSSSSLSTSPTKNPSSSSLSRLFRFAAIGLTQTSHASSNSTAALVSNHLVPQQQHQNQVLNQQQRLEQKEFEFYYRVQKEALMSDFKTRLWFSYRRDFAPIVTPADKEQLNQMFSRNNDHLHQMFTNDLIMNKNAITTNSSSPRKNHNNNMIATNHGNQVIYMDYMSSPSPPSSHSLSALGDNIFNMGYMSDTSSIGSGGGGGSYPPSNNQSSSSFYYTASSSPSFSDPEWTSGGHDSHSHSHSHLFSSSSSKKKKKKRRSNDLSSGKSAVTKLYESWSCYTSDSGWGCMMRSGQMLLAQAYLHLFCGREFRVMPEVFSHQPQQASLMNQYRTIVRWFIDEEDAPYSIHRIALCGTLFNKKVGEWFGPTDTSNVLKRLVDCHMRDQFFVHIAEQGGIYIDEIMQLCTDQTSDLMMEQAKQLQQKLANMLGDVSAASDSHEPPQQDNNENVTPRKVQSKTADSKEEFWRPVLILVPLRLGLDCINPIYIPSLKEVLQSPQCVGIMGGKPRSSLYFVGYQDDHLIYLDPHTTQKKSFRQSSYHSREPLRMRFSDIDPSLAIGFMCKDKKDFDEFCQHALKLAKFKAPIWSTSYSRPSLYSSSRSKKLTQTKKKKTKTTEVKPEVKPELESKPEPEARKSLQFDDDSCDDDFECISVEEVNECREYEESQRTSSSESPQQELVHVYQRPDHTLDEDDIVLI